MKHKSGATLVEMIVTLLLLSILMTMTAAIISPASRMFARLRKLQFAQMVLDNTAEELQAQTRGAVDYVKIYEKAETAANLIDAEGVSSGAALEFVNTDSYVELISFQGVPETVLVRGDQETGKSEAMETGRLITRYYWQQPDGSYHYTTDGRTTARAVQNVFTDGYYMDTWLALTFSYPAGVEDGDELTYLTANLALYSDEAQTELILEDSITLDFRYRLVRQDEATATAGSS